MITLTEVFRDVSDVESFLSEYRETQIPIVIGLIGVRSVKVEKGIVSPTIPNSGQVLVRIEFGSMSELEDALHSEQGIATAKNIRRFHEGPIDFMLTTLVEER